MSTNVINPALMPSLDQSAAMEPDNSEAGSSSSREPPSVNHVVISRFSVANGMTAQVKRAFRNRPHKVDGADGFLRMEVISPLDDPREIWLITFWRDEQSYKSWHHSHLYHEAHCGIPDGLKLVPKSTQIRCFEGVAS